MPDEGGAVNAKTWRAACREFSSSASTSGATQDAVEEHDVVFLEVDLGRVAHPERRPILNHPLSGECSCVLDRS
jgi:hypothetical protein